MKNNINIWYGEDYDYIHLKFGDARKAYNFTDEFRRSHPTFCKEYERYWHGNPDCQFEDPLQLANYVERWNIPIHFYFNYTDTPAKSIEEVKAYLCRERFPRGYGEFVNGEMRGWDGEKENNESDH